mmetsp:Transcript_18751/g.58762  ORF Transcript_18751/g.58762 Transcript_18751/m.58762 type:complete len:695 (+) Transcript_18751:26-2110(+)
MLLQPPQPLPPRACWLGVAAMGTCSSCLGMCRTPVPKHSSVFLDADEVAYVSDVEGHWEYFCNYVELSNCLSFARPGDHRQARSSEDLELELKDGCHFVFGGDACDKGPGTLRFLEAMVRLKQRYPERVHLLMGNRDINKMRWTSELAQPELDRLGEVPAAYWVPEACRVSHLQYLRRLAAAEEGLPDERVTEAMARRRNTKANKLRYMLKCDMGADGDFEFRRQELAHIRQRELASITDDEVVQSYEESVGPRGWMREYLRHAQLGVLLGKSLFVHGQIIGNDFPRERVRGADEHGVAWSVRVVPGEERPVDSVQQWLVRLNAWARRQVRDWERRPTWRQPPQQPTYEAWSGRGASELISYGTPASRVPTVVYCRFLTAKCMPLHYPPELVSYLKRNGVQNVVVGHTPHGNAPTVIQNDGVTVVMGDTSFSHMSSDVHYRGDNRGTAVSQIVIGRDKCCIQGYTEKAQFFEYSVAPEGADPYVGRMQSGEHLQKKFFVKAKLPQRPGEQDASYLLSHVEGFGYEYAVCGCEQVQKVLAGLPVETDAEARRTSPSAPPAGQGVLAVQGSASDRASADGEAGNEACPPAADEPSAESPAGEAPKGSAAAANGKFEASVRLLGHRQLSRRWRGAASRRRQAHAHTRRRVPLVCRRSAAGILAAGDGLPQETEEDDAVSQPVISRNHTWPREQACVG